jgi:hypothetical protein
MIVGTSDFEVEVVTGFDVVGVVVWLHPAKINTLSKISADSQYFIFILNHYATNRHAGMALSPRFQRSSEQL